MPSITSLVAAANRLIGVVARGPTPPGRPRTNSPPPHFTPERGTPTIEDPDPTIEEQSAAAFAAFTVVAHDCAAAGNSAAFGSGALDERAGQAVADLSIALYASEPWGGPADPRPLVGR